MSVHPCPPPLLPSPPTAPPRPPPPAARPPARRGAEHTLPRAPPNGTEPNGPTAGRGPAVPLLHGFPHPWRLWTHVTPELARPPRVIAPDLRGFGASARP